MTPANHPTVPLAIPKEDAQEVRDFLRMAIAANRNAAGGSYVFVCHLIEGHWYWSDASLKVLMLQWAKDSLGPSNFALRAWAAEHELIEHYHPANTRADWCQWALDNLKEI